MATLILQTRWIKNSVKVCEFTLFTLVFLFYDFKKQIHHNSGGGSMTASVLHHYSPQIHTAQFFCFIYML